VKSTIAPNKDLGESTAAGIQIRNSISSAPSDTMVSAVEMGNLCID
jgi:hypothetical protein